MARILFITGTDTGVGKTVCTAVLLRGMRASGVKALAMKPYCSGDRDDVRRLQAEQSGEMTDEVCNPWFFEAVLAPGVAASQAGTVLRLKEAVDAVHAMADRCEVLLVEGAGGVMVPLGGGAYMIDLIERLQPEVWVVASNRLGTLNHTLLTVEALRRRTERRVGVLLVAQAEPDESAASNARILGEMVGDEAVLEFPWLGSEPYEKEAFEKNEEKVKKVLAEILG